MTKDDSYTRPKLRSRLKDKIQAGKKGGKAGQWSARKAQLLVREYEKAGGGYRGKKDERQKHLSSWGEQDWRDRGGERYLPKVAWQVLSRSEREATDSKKAKGNTQRVANTDAAKQARNAAEVVSAKAPEARRLVAKLDRPTLTRAKKGESRYGKDRKTVLAAIEDRVARLSEGLSGRWLGLRPV